MGCASGLGRIVLVVLNLVFLLVSLALIATGAILRFFAHEILHYLGEFGAVDLNSLKDLGIPNITEVSQLPFLDEIGVALLAFGCILLVISFSACCGACYKFRPLLIVFVILMVVMVLAQAVVGGLFLAKKLSVLYSFCLSIVQLHDTIKEKLGDKIHDEYDPKMDTDDTFSQAINIMNYMLECCGISSYKDFGAAPAASCCTKDNMNNNLAKCKTLAAGSGDFNEEGCYAKLQGTITDNLTLAGIILALLLLLQVVEVVFAILIVKDANAVGPV